MHRKQIYRLHPQWMIIHITMPATGGTSVSVAMALCVTRY